MVSKRNYADVPEEDITKLKIGAEIIELTEDGGVTKQILITGDSVDWYQDGLDVLIDYGARLAK